MEKRKALSLRTRGMYSKADEKFASLYRTLINIT